MKLLKKIFLLAVVGVMTLQMVGCSDKNKADNNDKRLYEVTLDEFNLALENNMVYYQEQYKEQWDTMKEDESVKKRMEEIALEQVILDKVLINEANIANTKVTKREIDEEYDRIKTEYNETDNFNEFLTKNNMTEESYKENIRNQFLVDYFLKAKADDIIKKDPSTNELRDFYNTNLNTFKQVRASHILVDTEEEALDVKRRLSEGEIFEEIALDVSMCPSSIEGGDLGYFERDKMVSEFSDAAFSMSIGEISDPVKTDFGYHIIKLVDIVDNFDKVNQEELLQQYRVLTYNKMLTDYIDNADVKLPEELQVIRDRIKNNK